MADSVAVLIVGETQDGRLATISAELLGAGRRLADELGGELAALLVGSGVAALAADAAALGADRVLVADHPALADYVGDLWTPVVAEAIKRADPAVVLLGQTFIGRELGPRVAFRLGAGLTTDCTALRIEAGRVVATKPVYGGSAVAEYAATTRPAVATLRPRAFPAAEPVPGRTAPVEPLAVAPDPAAARTKLVETVRAAAAEGPTLKDAKIVVAGGRGLGGPENWHYVEELARALGAAVGATRAVTDAGWVPPSYQVGLTGATISPDLYITVGISGAVQHLAGISGARNVVAINKDPEANIFKHARYGVVGNWKEVLPAFTRKVKELRGQ